MLFIYDGSSGLLINIRNTCCRFYVVFNRSKSINPYRGASSKQRHSKPTGRFIS